MKCAYCGKEFTATRRTKKFCSKLCGQRFRRNYPLEDYVKTCKHCGKEFTTTPPPPKIIIPAAVAENRKPTVDELLDWIFRKGATK